MSWSRIQNTPLARAAKARMEVEPYRRYHTWAHVQCLYHHAECTLNLPYCQDLDKAIAGHDAVYDALGNNEKRSALWLKETDPSVSDVSLRMIHDTESHALREDDNRIILLDLMDFTSPELTRENHSLIRQEACEMYGIPDATFFEKSIEFLEGLLNRISDSAIQNAPEPDRPFFLEIRKGIHFSADLSRNAFYA